MTKPKKKKSYGYDKLFLERNSQWIAAIVLILLKEFVTWGLLKDKSKLPDFLNPILSIF